MSIIGKNLCRGYKAVAEEVLEISGTTTNAGNRYRSDALQLEVQLSEALSHVNKGSSNGESPSTVGTAVCLCLLSQIAEKNGPFQVVLARIKDELEGAIYSDEFNADSGTKWLDQVPYFAIVKKLREENSKQSKEIKKWYRELSTTKSEVEKINLKIQELEYRLATKDSSISELKDNIERAKKREERYLTIIEVEEFARFDIVVENMGATKEEIQEEFFPKS